MQRVGAAVAVLLTVIVGLIIGIDKAAQPGGAGGDVSDGVVVIQGIFDPTGERLLELKPVHRYSYRSGSIPNQKEGRFTVVVTYRTGKVTKVPFDALVADDSYPGRVRHGFFEVIVPVRGEISFILVTDAGGRRVFARIDGSEIRRR